MPKISYIQPLYHVPQKNIDHIAEKTEFRKTLQLACEDMLKNNSLLATYIPEKIHPSYGLNDIKKNVTTLLKPIPMPEGHDMTDYNHIDSKDGTNRWPYGWPFKVIFNVPVEKQQTLKYLIENAKGPNTFKVWSDKFLTEKPMKLFLEEREALERYFSTFIDLKKIT